MPILNTDLISPEQAIEATVAAHNSKSAIENIEGMTSSASEIDGSVKNKVPSSILDSTLLTKVKANTWLMKHFSSTKNLVDSYWAHVPIGDGYYSTFALGKFTTTVNTSKHIGRMILGLIGTYTHHTSAIKVGSFSSSTFDYTLGGNQAYSTTAGDTITFNINGHTAVARLSIITNGGCAIVSVDGDWTKANRLPLFTDADFISGKCRETDVGKRYIETGSVGDNVPDVHIPIFDGLDDSSHNVVFETTGTKNSISSGTRSYIGGVVGCSASDIGTTLNGTTKVFAHVEIVQDFAMQGSSAMIYTPEIEKNTANTWEFLGEVHSGETDIDWKIEVDGADQTSISSGAYAQGAVIKFIKTTTIATTDLISTPVCKKRQNIVFTAYHKINCTVDWSCEWLVDKRVRSSYSLMLPIGRFKIGTTTKVQDRWTQVNFGDYQSIPSDLNTNDNAMHGVEEAMYAVISSDKHDVKAYAVMLDYAKSVNYFSQSSPSFVTVHDRADFYDKVYFFRSTQQNLEIFKAGDKIGGVIGFGLKI
jgi:hypothetical protein